MKAPSSISVFAVPPLEAGQTQALLDAVLNHPFRACLPGKETSEGWCDVEDPSQPPTLHSVDGRFFAIGVRRDTKTVPPALLQIRVAEAARDWQARHGRGDCPRAVRRELTSMIELELLAAAQPKPAVGVVLYDGRDGRLYVGATTGPVHQAAAAVWHATFGALPVPLGPLDLCRSYLDARTLEHLTLDLVDEGHLHVRQEQLGRFLAWLWWRAESSTTALPHILRTARYQEGTRLAWVAMGGITLADVDSRKRRLSVTAEDAVRDPALRVALIEGHEIDSLTLKLTQDERWIFDVTIEAQGGDLRIKSFRSHKLEGEATDQLAALALLVEDLFAVLCELFSAWARGPGSADGQSQSLRSLRVWLEGQVGDWVDKNISGTEGNSDTTPAEVVQ